MTVRSEIARGYTEINSATFKGGATLSLVDLEGDLADVIINNQARQKDSDGFMLGARLATVKQIDFLLHWDTVKERNSAEQIAAAQKHCRHDVAEIRTLQKQLGIDDDALISAIGVTKPEGITRIKALLASYDGEK